VLASLECPIHTVLVAAGWRVTLFSERGFSGTVVEHTGDGGEAALSLREPPVSLIVEPPVLAEAAIVFERARFGGRWQVLTPGRYRVDRLTLAVGGIRSLQLPAGWRAVLDRGPSGKGACDASVPDLDAWRAGAPIQALEILAPGCELGGRMARVRLIGDHSGLPLHVATRLNAPVQLGPPEAHMYFMVHPSDGGWFSLAGLSVASHEAGASLCAASAPEERILFRWVPLADGTVAIQSRGAGLVLDVWGAGRAPGTPIVQWYPHLGRNQRFDLSVAPAMA